MTMQLLNIASYNTNTSIYCHMTKEMPSVTETLKPNLKLFPHPFQWFQHYIVLIHLRSKGLKLYHIHEIVFWILKWCTCTHMCKCVYTFLGLATRHKWHISHFLFSSATALWKFNAASRFARSCNWFCNLSTNPLWYLSSKLILFFTNVSFSLNTLCCLSANNTLLPRLRTRSIWSLVFEFRSCCIPCQNCSSYPCLTDSGAICVFILCNSFAFPLMVCRFDWHSNILALSTFMSSSSEKLLIESRQGKN